MKRYEAKEESLKLLNQVGIPDPDRRIKDYPHQFSGGMQQRIMIAMALSCRPDLIIADEPTTALDVTVQAQIFELIEEMRVKFGTAVLIITHNLGVVARYVERLNVMYAGSLIETGSTDEVYARPHHPYTKGLLQSVPRLDKPRSKHIEVIEGMPPDLANLPSGCSFAERCSFVMSQCREEKPQLKEVGVNHFSACFLDFAKLD
jgi:oligopeptide/dipeptide ABC transporter ATP-binding protein